MKRFFAVFLILQFVFASLMATSHLALAGSDVHEKPHFHLLDSDVHHHAEFSDAPFESEHTGEIHIHLTFLEACDLDVLSVSPIIIDVPDADVLVFSSLITPLLAPPNI